MNGLTLDAAALIALERDVRPVVTLVTRALQAGATVVVPAGVVAQVWRDGRVQARVARLLALDRVIVEPLNHARARAAGQLCGNAGTSDIVDASVVLCARAYRTVIVSSDEADLRRLDPNAVIVAI